MQSVFQANTEAHCPAVTRSVDGRDIHIHPNGSRLAGLSRARFARGRKSKEKCFAALGGMSLFVKVFGCRPCPKDAAYSGGRRPKTSKGGNRGKGYVWLGGVRYGDLSAADGAGELGRACRARR